MSLRRKLAIATWSAPREGNIYGKLTVDATEAAAEGRSYIGVSRAMSENPFRNSGRPELRRHDHPLLSARSHTAMRNGQRLIRWFRDAYRDALEVFREGGFDVEFPAGTWWMVQHAGARVGPSITFADYG